MHTVPISYGAFIKKIWVGPLFFGFLDGSRYLSGDFRLEPPLALWNVAFRPEGEADAKQFEDVARYATFALSPLAPARPAAGVDGVIEINQARAIAGG